MRLEKLVRAQSSLKRLGAPTRRTASVSSYESGVSGRIQALICCGGSSCSSRWTQVCQKFSIYRAALKPRFYPVRRKLSTGKGKGYASGFGPDWKKNAPG